MEDTAPVRAHPAQPETIPRFEAIGPEPAECRIASFEHGSEGVHHGRIPGFG
jgi:hypothetical protein